ncbi:MAG: hypothetical protein WCE52_21785, partial [Candidatus Acidiferrum sp.]
QKGGRHTLSGDIRDNDLSGVRIDGEVVVVVATYAPRGVHHPSYFEPRDGWFARRKKKALNFRGQLHVIAQIITLVLNGFEERFLLFDITLDHMDNESETQQCRQIVEDPKSQGYLPWGIKIVEYDASNDKSVADFLAQENRSYGER